MLDTQHCKEYLEKISAYIDGELDPQLCQILEEHLKGCDNCTIIFNTLKKTIELYQQTDAEVGLPQSVKSRLYKRLDLDDITK
jgi:anti-sigma factor RsiW